MSLVGYSLEQERLLQIEDARLDKLESTVANEGVYSKVPQTQYNAKVGQLDAKDATHTAAILDVDDKKLDVTTYNAQVLSQSSTDGAQTGRLDALDILVDSKVAQTAYEATVVQLTNANTVLGNRATALDNRFDAINNNLADNLAAQIEAKATNLEFDNLAAELRAADSTLAAAIATKVTEATQIQVDALQNTNIGTRLLISDYESKMSSLDASNANIETKLLAVDQFIRLLADTYVIKDSSDNIKNYSANFQTDLGSLTDVYFSFVNRDNNILNIQLQPFAYNTFYGSIKVINASNSVIGTMTKADFDSVNFTEGFNTPSSQQFPLSFNFLASDDSLIYSKTLTYAGFQSLTNISAVTIPVLSTTNVSGYYVFNVGDNVNIQITNTGGAWESLSVNGLPQGLSLNTSTGVISGTPTTPQASTACIITASNSAGMTALTIYIQILAPPPARSFVRYGADQSTVSPYPASMSNGLVINGVNSYIKVENNWSGANLFKEGQNVGVYYTKSYTYAHLTSSSNVFAKYNNVEYDISSTVTGASNSISNAGDALLAYQLVTRNSAANPSGVVPAPVTGAFAPSHGGEGLYLVTFGDYVVNNNLNSYMVTFTKIGELGIIGAAVGSWNSDRVKFTKSSTNNYKFEASAVPFVGGQFKIRSDNGWAAGGTFSALDIEVDVFNNVTGTGTANFNFTGVDGYYDVALYLQDPTRLALELTPSASLTPAPLAPGVIAPTSPTNVAFNSALNRIVFTFANSNITNSIAFIDMNFNYNGTWSTWKRFRVIDFNVSGAQVLVPVPNGQPNYIDTAIFFSNYTSSPVTSQYTIAPIAPTPTYFRYGPNPSTVPASPATMNTGLVVNGANTYVATTTSADFGLGVDNIVYTTNTYSYAYLSGSTLTYVKINGTEYDISPGAITSNFAVSPDETFYFDLVARDASTNPNGIAPPVALWGPANSVGQGLYLVTYGSMKQDGTEIGKGISFTRMTEFGLIGQAVGGWDSLKATFTKSSGDNLVYTASAVTFTAGDFKIRTADGWPTAGIFNALDIEGNGAGGLQSIGGPNLIFNAVNGTYNVTLHVRDPYNMTLELTPV